MDLVTFISKWPRAIQGSGWISLLPKSRLVNCRGDIVRRGDQDGLVQDVPSPQTLLMGLRDGLLYLVYLGMDSLLPQTSLSREL